MAAKTVAPPPNSVYRPTKPRSCKISENSDDINHRVRNYNASPLPAWLSIPQPPTPSTQKIYNIYALRNWLFLFHPSAAFACVPLSARREHDWNTGVAG